MSPQDDSPDFDRLLNPDSLPPAPKEASAEERIAKSQRIAANNDRLKREGEISGGTGKPKFSRKTTSLPWVTAGIVIGITIIVVVLIVR